MMSALIERAKGHINAPADHQNVDDLQYKLDNLKIKRDNLFGSELDAKKLITNQILEIQNTLRLAENALGSLPILDIEVLSWRTPMKIGRFSTVTTPSLALVSIHEGKMGFASHSDYDWNGNRRRQSEIQGERLDQFSYLYMDVVADLHAMRGKVSLTYSFTGVIPDSTREKIKAAEKSCKDIFLLCDATDSWKFSSMPEPKPLRLDPIVLAHMGEIDFRVIDIFDPTSVEEYIAAEFTS